MAEIKLSGLPLATTMAAGDKIPFTSDPGGTPISKNITKTNLFSNLTTGYVPYKPAGALANSPIFTDGTNVGIGTTGPTRKLVVSDTSTIGGIATFNNIATNANANFTLFAGSVLGLMPNDNSLLLANVGNAGDIGFRAAVAGGVQMILQSSGNVGIGMVPTVQFELSGSIGQKASGTTWSNPSDSRLKKDVILADLDRCFEIVKNIPLKRSTYRDEVFGVEQAKDRSKLGWLADDVKPFFPKATPIIPFILPTQIPDGEEEYQEQDFEIRNVERTSIEIIDGKPVLVKKTIGEKDLLFDQVEVRDENGNIIIVGNKAVGDDMPLTHRMPRMITKTRPKFRQEIIKDCLTLDADQIYAAMFGALQRTMAKVETLEARLN